MAYSVLPISYGIFRIAYFVWHMECDVLLNPAKIVKIVKVLCIASCVRSKKTRHPVFVLLTRSEQDGGIINKYLFNNSGRGSTKSRVCAEETSLEF